MLDIRNLSVSFTRYTGLLQQRETIALNSISLGIERGEVLALLGASGAGKSLLAHALFGILPPNATRTGELLLDGAAVYARMYGRRMGLVPQSASYLDPTVRCGHQLAWAAKRCGRVLAPADVAATLARFGLEPATMHAFPHELSGGMARRVMLAIASIGGPDLIVADEPTSGLDPENAQMVLGHLGQMAAAGSAILLITHDLERAVSCAHRVAILRSGELVGIEQSSAFTGDGGNIEGAYARALWRAMPRASTAGSREWLDA